MTNSLKTGVLLSVSALGALLAASPSFAGPHEPIEGQWTNPKGSVVVRIAPCGQAFCGTVVSASAKARATARKGGTSELLGTQVMRDFRPTGDGTFKGRAFDPKRDIHAPATIRMNGRSTFIVRGCLVGGFICKEQRWTRTG